MEAIPKILEGLSALLWPLIVGVCIYVFRSQLMALIDSAKSRKFSIKIGGQELTMEEANEQQRLLIADLQGQVSELRDAISRISQQAFVVEEEEPIIGPSHPVILWVDDHPKNNSYFIEQLGEAGISTDLALSTEEGLAKFRSGRYLAVISDMSRREDGKTKPEAGVELLQAVRSVDADVPFFIFCGSAGVRRGGDKARQLGATGITSSPSKLYSLLKLDKIRKIS